MHALVKGTIALILLLSTLGPASAAEDCYFRKTTRRAVIGNSRIEIRLDLSSGVVTGLLNKQSGAEYLSEGTPEAFRMIFSTVRFHGARADDLWSAVSGTEVRSSLQRVASMNFERIPGGARLTVVYDRLRLEKRTIDVGVRFTIELRDRDEETRWQLSLRNEAQGIVREVQFPLLNGLAELDSLIMPNESGQKLTNPVDRLSDDIPAVSLEYPGRGSMQWFEYSSAKAGLYLASYDPALNYTRLCFGRSDETDRAGMWIAKYPFAALGDSWDSPPLAVGIHSGDWHWGADRYRTWLESWTRKSEVPRKVVELIGGLREIGIMTPSGKVSNRYEDMVALARQVSEAPNGVAFMASGWLFEGHDTYFPEYFPIPALGGEEALEDAVDKVHGLGVGVTAYVNGRLCNIETDTYKKHGKRWAVLGKAPDLGVNDTDFFELHENWNKSWARAGRGEGWFSVMCPSAKGWQDHLVGEISRVIGKYHFDGVFLDQPGSYYAELCYNETHGHKTPASAWGPGYLELFRRIREEMRRLDPDSILWTEGMNDAFGQYMDYYMDKNPLWLPMRIHPECETFVEMWRYTLPSYVIVNDPGAYSYLPSQDPIYGENYKFVLGIRGLSRSPTRGIEPETSALSNEHAQRRAVIERIEQLWIKGGQYLFHGRFRDDVGLTVSDPAVLAKVYLGPEGLAVPVWNTGSRSASFELRLDLRAVGLDPGRKYRAISLDGDVPLKLESSDGFLTVSLRLPAHEIDAAVIETTD